MSRRVLIGCYDRQCCLLLITDDVTWSTEVIITLHSNLNFASLFFSWRLTASVPAHVCACVLCTCMCACVHMRVSVRRERRACVFVRLCASEEWRAPVAE